MGGPPHQTTTFLALKRALLAALVVGVAVVGCVGTLLAVWPSVASGYLKTRVAAALSSATDRDVTISAVTLEWAGGLRVGLRGLVMAPAMQLRPPLTVEEVEGTFNVAAWLTSVGTRWEIRDVHVNRPTLHLARRHDGKVAGEDVLKRLRERWQGPSASPHVRILGVRMDHGVLEFSDDALTHEGRLEGGTLTLDQWIPGQPSVLTLDAVLDNAGGPANVHVLARSAALPLDGAALEVPPLDVTIHVDGLDLAPWSVLLPVDALQASAGVMEADVQGSCAANLADAHLHGGAKVAGLRVSLNGQSGAPADVQVSVDADVDFRSAQLRMRRLDVAANGFSAVERVTATWAPVLRVEDLNLELLGDAHALTAFAPPGLFPPELSLDGELAVLATARNNAGDLTIRLDKAHVVWTDIMDKRAGTPLNLVVRTETAGNVLDVPLFRVQLDTATLAGSAQLDLATGTVVRADLDTGTLALSTLRNVFPVLATASRRRQALGFVRVRATGEPGAWTGTVQADGVRMTLPWLRAQGAAVAEGRVKRDARGWAVEGQLNFTDLALTHTSSDGEVLVDKPRGTRLHAFLSGRLRRPSLELDSLVLEAGGSSALVQGVVTALASRQWAVDLTMSTEKLLAEDLGSVVPMVRGWPLQAHAEGKAHLRFASGEPRAASLEVGVFSVRHQRSHASGSARAEGWPNPRVRLDVRDFSVDARDARPWLPASWPALKDASAAGELLLDGHVAQPENMEVMWTRGVVHAFGQDAEVQAVVRNLKAPRVAVKLKCDAVDPDAAQRAWAPAADRKRAPSPDFKKLRKALAPLLLTAELEIGSVPLPDFTLTDVTGRLTVKDGVMTLNPLRARALGGVVELDSSTVELVENEVRARLRVTVTDVESGQLLNRKETVLDGAMNAVADLTLHGNTVRQCVDGAQGPVAFRFKSLTVYNLDLLGSLQLPGGAQNPLATRPREIPPTILYNGNGAGMLKDGRLTFTRTLATRTSFGFLSVDGWVALDGYTYLTGVADIAPEWVEHETQGGYRPKSGARTPVRITGMPGELVIHDVNARAFLKDQEVPSLLEGAGRLAQETRERVARRAEEEMANLRKRMEDDRRTIRQDLQRTLEELRANWQQGTQGPSDGGPAHMPGE